MTGADLMRPDTAETHDIDVFIYLLTFCRWSRRFVRGLGVFSLKLQSNFAFNRESATPAFSFSFWGSFISAARQLDLFFC